MANTAPLVGFGIAIVIIVGAFVVIPFLRGKSELMSAWNMLLLGVIIFTGLGSIAINYPPRLNWREVEWVQPSAKEVRWYMMANSVFIITLLTAYYLNTPAKNFAQNRLKKWPEFTAPVTFFIIAFCFVVIVASTVLRHATFIGPLLSNLAWIGVPAGCVFSFSLWNRNRLNAMWLLLFLGVFSFSGLYAMVVSGGRRLLIAIFLAPFLCYYWSNLRYWRPVRALVVMGIAGLMILGITAAYSQIRWYNLRGKEARTASGIVQQLKQLQTQGDFFKVFLEDRLGYLTQENGRMALLTQRYIAQGLLDPVPLNTLRFLIAYPIPHKIWAGKPEVIGLTITRDVIGIRSTNWGIGIAGHGAYEGGIPVLMLYAVLLAFGARILDEPLRLQPGNPFLIYMQASAFPHVVGIARGDFGIMTKEVAQCVLFTVILGYVCRVIFGTRRRNPISLRHPTSNYGPVPSRQVM